MRQFIGPTLYYLSFVLIMFASSGFILQRQDRRVAEMAAFDIAPDLARSDIASAFRKIGVYKRLGQINLALDDENASERDQFCIRRFDVPVAMDGIVLGQIGNCLSPQNFFRGLVNSPEALVLWIFALAALLALAAFRSRLQTIRLQNQRSQEIADLAEQVAHDIRSPLSALTLVAARLDGISEEKRDLIVSATNRIQDIASFLLSKRKLNTLPHRERTDVIEMVRNIGREKHEEFRTYSGIDFKIEIDDGERLFCQIDQMAVQRALSNVINNAVEALPNQTGFVQLKVVKVRSEVEILVIDNGCGIPKNVLPKLGFRRGLSYGKGKDTASGNGLGLSQSRQAVEDSGGRFWIESDINIGTKVHLAFQRV